MTTREKNPRKVESGKRGGRARAESLSPKRRREIAHMGGVALNRGLTAEERRDAARRAIKARWARWRAKKARENARGRG